MQVQSQSSLTDRSTDTCKYICILNQYMLYQFNESWTKLKCTRKIIILKYLKNYSFCCMWTFIELRNQSSRGCVLQNQVTFAKYKWSTISSRATKHKKALLFYLKNKHIHEKRLFTNHKRCPRPGWLRPSQPPRVYLLCPCRSDRRSSGYAAGFGCCRLRPARRTRSCRVAKS